ncbi:MAG: zinc ribbon domain-containing protein [Planctomycetes bacterium]|nr:zinc ribbon domain-containing protein [Planctomycetota bacterium]
MNKLIDPRHENLRSILRVVGPSVAAVGLVFMVIGIGSFFLSFGSFGPTRFFWCAFVGMPLLFVGVTISKFAFLGAVTRYTASEVAPVGKDVTNYMVDGTKDAIRDVATAIGEGFSAAGSGVADRAVRCGKCGSENEVTANFCQQCGAPMSATKRCEKCGDLNDADARFCDHCGAPAV